jgi:maltose O-acetyltransferase
MQSRLERLRAMLLRSQPFELEIGVRALLIHYHFHCSDRARLELVGEGPRSLNVLTPTSFKGQGLIRVHASASFGVARSPGSYACSYIESRTPQSLIEIGAESVFNNRLVLLAEGASIRFGARCLVGPEVFVTDSNSHDLRLSHRRLPDPKPQGIEIEDDVFIGARAMILKGARIGRGSVVAAGAVVPPRFQAPPLSIIAGNPATVIGSLAAEPTP